LFLSFGFGLGDGFSGILDHLGLRLEFLKFGLELLSFLVIFDFLILQKTFISLVGQKLLMLEMILFGFGRDSNSLGD